MRLNEHNKKKSARPMPFQRDDSPSEDVCFVVLVGSRSLPGYRDNDLFLNNTALLSRLLIEWQNATDKHPVNS